LFFQQVQHELPVAGGAGFLCDEFIPLPDIPGDHAHSGGIFSGEIPSRGAETEKCMDILPSDQQADEGDQDHARAQNEPEDKKKKQELKEKREKEGQQGDPPPFVGVQKSIAA